MQNCWIKTLQNIQLFQKNAEVQDHSLACYAKKLYKEEAQIDWQLSAQQIINKIRAFNPTPVCYADILGQTLRIYDATIITVEELPETAKIGEIVMQKKTLFYTMFGRLDSSFVGATNQ